MNQPTKYYSEIQETKIAKALGWERVVASGARNFHPGDIKSDRWLGECKTHTKPSDKVKFTLAEWRKIQSEAQSVMKTPALFVDDGTQELKNTWVMVNHNCIPLIDSILVPSDIRYHLTNTMLWFDVDTLKYAYGVRAFHVIMQETGRFPYVQVALADGQIIAIMSFSAFQSQFGE